MDEIDSRRFWAAPGHRKGFGVRCRQFYSQAIRRQIPGFARRIYSYQCGATEDRAIAGGRTTPFWRAITLHHRRETTDSGSVDSTYEGAVQINEELEAKQRELREAKHTLEARVAERTAELARANEHLQIELAERRRAEDQVKELNEDLERRVAERTAQLRAANEELDAFSYSVSHDLRAPLRHIGGFAHLLVENHILQLTPEARQQLELIQEGTQKMGGMIDDLLNLA